MLLAVSVLSCLRFCGHLQGQKRANKFLGWLGWFGWLVTGVIICLHYLTNRGPLYGIVVPYDCAEGDSTKTFDAQGLCIFGILMNLVFPTIALCERRRMLPQGAGVLCETNNDHGKPFGFGINLRYQPFPRHLSTLGISFLMVPLVIPWTIGYTVASSKLLHWGQTCWCSVSIFIFIRPMSHPDHFPSPVAPCNLADDNRITKTSVITIHDSTWLWFMWF